jgi:hypothetical protein
VALSFVTYALAPSTDTAIRSGPGPGGDGERGLGAEGPVGGDRVLGHRIVAVVDDVDVAPSGVIAMPAGCTPAATVAGALGVRVPSAATEYWDTEESRVFVT